MFLNRALPFPFVLLSVQGWPERSPFTGDHQPAGHQDDVSLNLLHSFDTLTDGSIPIERHDRPMYTEICLPALGNEDVSPVKSPIHDNVASHNRTDELEPLPFSYSAASAPTVPAVTPGRVGGHSHPAHHSQPLPHPYTQQMPDPPFVVLQWCGPAFDFCTFQLSHVRTGIRHFHSCGGPPHFQVSVLFRIHNRVDVTMPELLP